MSKYNRYIKIKRSKFYPDSCNTHNFVVNTLLLLYCYSGESRYKKILNRHFIFLHGYIFCFGKGPAWNMHCYHTAVCARLPRSADHAKRAIRNKSIETEPSETDRLSFRRPQTAVFVFTERIVARTTRRRRTVRSAHVSRV